MLSPFNKKSNLIFGILGLGIFLIVLFFSLLYLPANKIEIKRFFLIEKGEGIKEISYRLKKEGLIKSKSVFLLHLIITGKYKKIQAGYYLLSPSMSIPEVVEKFVIGDIVKEKITIIEGWNIQEIRQELEKREICHIPGEFLKLVSMVELHDPLNKDFSDEFDFLKDKPVNYFSGLEGYLFPDTYEISKSETCEQIIRKILKNFGRKLLPEIRNEIKKQNKTIFEIITIASLIEKEVRIFEDKKLVSGILWKRLKNSIPLQVDATITYLIGKKTTKISIEETKIDSPYNTYRYPGLPRGPICNPGLESILAAIYPDESSYWYYLSDPITSKTIFSQTLTEHNIAKEKYLR